MKNNISINYLLDLEFNLSPQLLLFHGSVFCKVLVRYEDIGEGVRLVGGIVELSGAPPV
jgi:hypothetical protein